MEKYYLKIYINVIDLLLNRNIFFVNIDGFVCIIEVYVLCKIVIYDIVVKWFFKIKFKWELMELSIKVCFGFYYEEFFNNDIGCVVIRCIWCFYII